MSGDDVRTTDFATALELFIPHGRTIPVDTIGKGINLGKNEKERKMLHDTATALQFSHSLYRNESLRTMVSITVSRPPASVRVIAVDGSVAVGSRACASQRTVQL